MRGAFYLHCDGAINPLNNEKLAATQCDDRELKGVYYLERTGSTSSICSTRLRPFCFAL